MRALRRRWIVVLMTLVGAALLAVGSLRMAEAPPVPYESGPADIGFLIGLPVERAAGLFDGVSLIGIIAAALAGLLVVWTLIATVAFVVREQRQDPRR